MQEDMITLFIVVSPYTLSGSSNPDINVRSVDFPTLFGLMTAFSDFS